MKTIRLLTALAFLSILAADGLSAQRRGTSGGSSGGGRSSPSGGGRSSGGGGSRGSSSGGSRGSATSGNRGGSSATSKSGRRGGTRGGATADAKAGASSGAGSTAQAGRRAGGKIGAIADEADRANARARGRVIIGRGVYLGSCWDCNYWGWYGGGYGWYHGGYWYPARRGYHRGDDEEEQPGQGYDDYPYASSDSSASFVRPHVERRRSFGAVTGQYFSDAGSTARSGRFGLEAARGLWRGELEYAYYAEPVAGGTDRMHDFRLAGGIQPRLGDHAYLTATIGVRGIAIPGGRSAGGLEGGLGVQLLPRKPFGLNLTGRAAAMSWNGQDYFALRELNTTGSVFVNRVEIQGGWHWLKVGSSPAFGGPVAGLRIWF